MSSIKISATVFNFDGWNIFYISILIITDTIPATITPQKNLLIKSSLRSIRYFCSPILYDITGNNTFLIRENKYDTTNIDAVLIIQVLNRLTLNGVSLNINIPFKYNIPLKIEMLCKNTCY